MAQTGCSVNQKVFFPFPYYFQLPVPGEGRWQISRKNWCIYMVKLLLASQSSLGNKEINSSYFICWIINLVSKSIFLNKCRGPQAVATCSQVNYSLCTTGTQLVGILPHYSCLTRLPTCTLICTTLNICFMCSDPLP